MSPVPTWFRELTSQVVDVLLDKNGLVSKIGESGPLTVMARHPDREKQHLVPSVAQKDPLLLVTRYYLDQGY